MSYFMPFHICSTKIETVSSGQDLGEKTCLQITPFLVGPFKTGLQNKG